VGLRPGHRPAAPTNQSVSDNIAHVKDHFTATRDVIKPAWDKITQAEIAIHPAYGWAGTSCR